MGAQYKRPRKSYKTRTFLVNGAYVAILTMNGVTGGFTAWGETRVDALRNVFDLAGPFVDLG